MTTGLRVRDLSVRLGGRDVVDRITFDLAPARSVAIVGPNGAGKTSLLRALVGLLQHRGTAMLDGADLSALRPRARARSVAYLPQGHEAHWPLPVRDIVALGRLPHGGSDPARLSPTDAASVAEAMRTTDVEGLADRAVTGLSGGERARVALARVFAVEAPLILADEPTASLDPRHQLAVMGALRARSRAGAIAVVVTHDLGLAARFADEVVVMENGRIAAAGPPGEALSAAVLRRVFGIEAMIATHRGEPVVVAWS